MVNMMHLVNLGKCNCPLIKLPNKLIGFERNSIVHLKVLRGIYTGRTFKLSKLRVRRQRY